MSTEQQVTGTVKPKGTDHLFLSGTVILLKYILSIDQTFSKRFFEMEEDLFLSQNARKIKTAMIQYEETTFSSEREDTVLFASFPINGWTFFFW